MDPTSSADEKAGNKASFGTTCRQLWIMSKAFFASERRHKALGFFIVLLTLALSVGGVQVLMSYVARDFMTAIELRDGRGFVHYAVRYIGVFALLTVVAVYARFAEERPPERLLEEQLVGVVVEREELGESAPRDHCVELALGEVAEPAPSWAAASTTAATSSGSTSGRAASWTRTSASSGMSEAASAFSTDSRRVTPPSTSRHGSGAEGSAAR